MSATQTLRPWQFKRIIHRWLQSCLLNPPPSPSPPGFYLCAYARSCFLQASSPGTPTGWRHRDISIPRWSAVSMGPAEAVLPAPFQHLILQSKLAHHPLQLLYSIPHSPFLAMLVIELAPTVLSLPVVEQACGDVIPTAELGRAAFPAHQLFHRLALEL